jgi:hypothetical protein
LARNVKDSLIFCKINQTQVCDASMFTCTVVAFPATTRSAVSPHAGIIAVEDSQIPDHIPVSFTRNSASLSAKTSMQEPT